METTKSILSEVLEKELTNLPIVESPSLNEDFPKKELLTDLNELRLMQIILARKAIIENSGYIGDLIKMGDFLQGDKLLSKWKIYKLNDGSDKIGVLWSHFDDDSWSVFFKGDNLEIESLYYEN
ncbi:hypothetical protein [Aureivirga sp. CE67]|uniref:hypothetical protein n=1 Tax=Aureivirga sp. CE67 TaxID=1788983 RepID=UPI0018CA2DC0|nr:hypothetical protein [Aureivirga sp. CE67]